MPIRQNILRKGKAPKQNLLGFDVFQDETGVLGDLSTSKFFKISEFPSVLPTGNSSFLIEGSDLLRPNVELKTELLDAQGNPIFHYGIPNYDNELPARRITIEIYDDDVVNGIGSFTILGELDPEKAVVPSAFQDTYNVRFSAPVSINKEIKNTRPIRFYGDPTITVSELVKGVIQPVYANNEKTATITGSVEVNTPDGGIPVLTPPGEKEDLIFGDSSQINEVGNAQSSYISKTKGEVQSSIFSPPIKEYIHRNNYPTYVVKAMEAGIDNSDDKITGTMEGGTFSITRPDLLVDSSRYPDSDWTKPTTFSTKILKVINSTTLRTSTFYSIRSKKRNQELIVPLAASASNSTITHEVGSVEKVVNQVFQRSFANVTVGNLRTFSGDTYKAKIYIKEDGSSGEFEKIYETLVESPNELIDQNSDTGFKSVGIFPTQSIVDNFWISSSATFTATQDDDTTIDGIILSGSTEPHANSFTFETSQSYSLEKNEAYLVDFDVAFKPQNKVQSDGTTKKDAKLEVFLTGPITSNSSEEFPLGEVELDEYDFNKINTFTVVKKKQISDFLTHNETNAPSGSLGFRLHSGEFILSDVRLRPFSETNFSPGFFKANVPMPKAIKRGQPYDFVVEFYDANNNLAEAVAIADDVTFLGPPQIIADGTDGLLTGSMFLGSVTSSGIEVHGGSAYIRSVGYDGFNKALDSGGSGFMMFSGSVSKSLNTSESYQGVGLELMDNSGANPSSSRFLKFRTNAEGEQSEFEVRTDNFLFGIEGVTNNYISGSNGNLEISSSNFALQEDGDVILQGTITAEAGGTIGGFTIGASSLAAGNVFQLSSSQNVEDPASMISSSKFKVSAGGQVSASDILVTGGTITSDVTVEGTFSANSILTPANIAGVGTTPENASASIDARGNANFRSGSIGGFKFDGTTLSSDSAEFIITGSTGQITGSDVLFTGGTIAGFTLLETAQEKTLFDVNKTLVLSGSSGEITGSKVLFTGGKIGGFNIVADGLSSINNTFQVTGSSGQITGSDVLFDGGKIGGFEIVGNAANVDDAIHSTDKALILSGSGQITGSTVLFTGGTIAGFTLLETAQESTIFDVNKTLILSGSSGEITGSKVLFTGGKIAGFNLLQTAQESTIFDDNKTLILSGSSGEITGSKVLFDGGKIGGFEIVGNAANVDDAIHSTDKSLILSGSGQITGSNFLFDGGKVGGFEVVGNATNVVDAIFSTDKSLILSGSGHITASNAKITGNITATSGDIGGFTISSTALTGTNFALDTDGKRITLGSSNNVFVADADDGIHLGHANFNDAPFSVSKAGAIKAESGVIGGFTITDSKIESSDFVSGLKGVRISTEQNGLIEAENARIRGTLSTTTFEKETINAVGGQLLVANSTMITGSSMFHSDTSASVANVTGFTNGEILMIKEVNDTGFTTEYLRVHSASRDSTDDNNLTGKLFVTRSYSNTTAAATGSEGFRGDIFGQSGSYEPGQVIVSTGLSGSGYIRLNANPKDPATPYMDIIERTGSGIYDTELKARLGDLSGLAASKVGSAAGFGLFTEKAFLTQDVTVGTLGTEHITIDGTSIRFIDNTTTMAELRGTTWTIGGAHGATDDVIVLSPGGGVAIQDSSNDKVVVDSDGVTITENNQVRAIFGATSVIGSAGAAVTSTSTDDCIRIADGTVSIFQDTNNKAVVNSSGLVITQGGADVASFGANSIITGGTITLRNSTNNNDKLVLSENSMVIFDNNNEVASFGANTVLEGGTVTIQNTTNNNDKVVLSENKLEIFDNNNVVAEFAANTVIEGGTITLQNTTNNNDKLVLSEDSMVIFDNNNEVASFGANTIIEGGTITLRNTTNNNDKVVLSQDKLQVFDNNTDVASFGAVTRIGDVANEHISASSAGISIKDGTATSALYGATAKIFDVANAGTYVEVGGGTIDIISGSVTGSSFSSSAAGFTASFFGAADKEERVEITDAGMAVFAADAQVANFGGDTVLTGGTLTLQSTGGTTGHERVVIENNSISMFANNAEVFDVTGGVVTIGSATDKVTINGTSGITIKENNVDTIQMVNGVVTVGSSTDNVKINGTSGITIRENNVDTIKMIDGTITLQTGTSSHEKLVLSDASIAMFSNNAKLVDITDGKISIGPAANAGATDGAVIGNIHLASGGAFIYGAAVDDYVNVKSDGVDVVAAGVTQAAFGATTVIGTSTDKVTLSSGGITIRENNVDTIAMASGVVTVGSSTDKVTINGTSGITIRENDADTISMINGVVTIGSSTDQVEINGTSGITIRENNKDNISLTDGTIKVGVDENDSTFIQIDSDSVDIIEDVGGANKTVASFGVSTTIGSSTDKVSISDSGITIRENNKDVISLASDVVTVGSSTDKVTINGTSGITIKENNVDTISMVNGVVTVGSSTDKVTINGTSGITIKENNADTISMVNGVVTIGSSTDKVTINGTSGITIRENNKDNISLTDGTIKVGVDENDSTFVQIDSDSVDIIEDVGGTDSNVASFGLATRIGPNANEKSRVEISSGAVQIINKDASGNDTTMLNFKNDGDIESGDFLIERTRLFGAGGDGGVKLLHNSASYSANGQGSATGTTGIPNTTQIKDERGDVICQRTGSVWEMKGDCYFSALEVDGATATTLITSGSRLFVQGTLTIDSGCVIHNDGGDGDTGANAANSDNSTSGYGDGGANSPTKPGSGGPGNALASGGDGAPGSRGGNPDTAGGGTAYGANGGAGGGNGGIVMIAARTIVNNGTIRSHGGAGGDGGRGASGTPGSGATGAADGQAGSAGSIVHVKI